MSPWLRQFMLISVVGMTFILGALLYFHVQLSHEYVKDQLETHNRNLAMVLRNSVLSVGLNKELSEGRSDLSDELKDRVSDTLAGELKWLPVVKVKIYGADSRILYSTVEDEIGRDASRNTGVRRALAGEPVANVVKRDQLNELDGSVETVDLHQQYIPIRHPESEKVHGVFEIYADISRILEDVGAKQATAFWSIGGILAIFYLVLALSYSKTHQLLLAERRKREEHLQDLVATRGELEERVEQRTEELNKSKQFLQSVIDGIGSPLLVIRPDYTIALMNRAARRLVPDGADSADFIHCYQISHRRDTPCDGEDHPCSFERVMDHGRPARVRHTHYDADNQPIIVDLLSTPLYAEDGTFEGVIEVEHDVTQMVRMQAGLIESEARLQAIMDNVPDGIVTCDPKGLIQSINPSARRLFGNSDSELIGRRLEEVLQGQIPVEVYQRQHTLQQEVHVVRGDGTEFPADVWIGPLAFDGEASCVAVIRDISARRAAQEELEKTRQQYFHQEKMAAIGHLAAGILHEVGNPIAAIAGAAHELKTVNICGNRPVGECPFDDVVSRNIELIDSQTSRLGKITREIADFASPRPRERELLDLNSLLRSTARLLSYDRRFRDVELRLELDRTLPAIVGVADQLTQVFMNLLINAMDAVGCSGDTRVSKIFIASKRDGEMVCVTVGDNGCGMSQETQARIMEPFFTTKAVGKGTGLGLSLCDSIVLGHGGFMHIESEEGEGTRVHVFLSIDEKQKNNEQEE